MALPTDTFTDANLDAFIPEIWGSKLNDLLRKKLVMASFFTNRSDELRDGGDTLYTPNITEMSANTKTNGTAVTLNNPTETKNTLVVDTWKEVSFLIEDREAAQVKKSYTIQLRYASNAAYTIAGVLDVEIAKLFSGFSNSVGASTTVVVDSDIRKAIGLLEGANVDIAEVAFFFDSKVFWNQVMGLTNFTLDANAALAGYSPLNGRVGQLYGIPVYRSNNIQYVSGTTGRVNALAHSDAIHWASLTLGGGSGEMGARLQTHYMAEYLGTLVTADMCFGVAENRDVAGVRFLTSAA